MKFTRLLSLLLFSSLLVACDSSTKSEDTPSPRSYSTLSGSVLLQSGKGLPGARVRLRSTGATTTTDANGKWSLSKVYVAAGVAARAAADTVEPGTDSVIITRDSQVIGAQVVDGSELDPLYVVQRDLFGGLSSPVSGRSYLIRAELTLPDQTKKTIWLWHNQVAKSFSGFIYTVAGTGTQNYSVSVQVLDAADSALVGLSPAVPFTSAAGDIQIPVFRYENLGLGVVWSGPTDTLRYDTAATTTFAMRATVSDTSIAGIGLLAPYTYSYAIGDSTWISGQLPSPIKLTPALLAHPWVKVKIVGSGAVTVTDSFKVAISGKSALGSKLTATAAQKFQIVVERLTYPDSNSFAEERVWTVSLRTPVLPKLASSRDSAFNDTALYMRDSTGKWVEHNPKLFELLRVVRVSKGSVTTGFGSMRNGILTRDSIYDFTGFGDTTWFASTVASERFVRDSVVRDGLVLRRQISYSGGLTSAVPALAVAPSTRVRVPTGSKFLVLRFRDLSTSATVYATAKTQADSTGTTAWIRIPNTRLKLVSADLF